MSAILAFLLGPNGIYAFLTAAIGAALLWARRSGAKSERNKHRAKEADSYEKHLRDIASASIARPRHRLPDDQHNRDNR